MLRPIAFKVLQVIKCFKPLYLHSVLKMGNDFIFKGFHHLPLVSSSPCVVSIDTTHAIIVCSLTEQTPCSLPSADAGEKKKEETGRVQVFVEDQVFHRWPLGRCPRICRNFPCLVSGVGRHRVSASAAASLSSDFWVHGLWRSKPSLAPSTFDFPDTSSLRTQPGGSQEAEAPW